MHRSTNALTYDVKVTDSRPIRKHPYILNPRKLKVHREEVEYMLENGMIEPSRSEWASPSVLVDKPDGTTMFCTEYRRVKAIRKVDCHPIPRMEDCIDRIGKAQYITKCDF